METKVLVKDELKEEKIWRLIIKYSVPAILAMMVTSLYNTVDRAFIGSMKDVGALAISGLGVTMPILTILGAFCVGLAVGGSTNIAIKLGEGNKEEAEKALGNTIAIELLVGIVMMSISIFFLEDILYIFGGEQIMANYNSNKKLVPEAMSALDKFKYEVASEVGVNLKDGYNGDISARDAGKIGGNMVRKMIQQVENNMANK